MRIQCQSRDLFEATNLVAGVVASNPTRPILHSLLLRGDAAGVVVQGTDLDVALSVRVDEAVVEKEGAVVLPAASFHAILREMRDPQISVEESDDRGRIQICSGSSSFWIPAGPVEEFPQIEFRPPASTLRIDRRAFLEMLRCVSVAAARDASRFQIHSVMVECVDEGIRLVSTDGKRMAIAERPVSEEESEGVGGSQYIIPLKGVDLLMKILPLDEREQVKLHLDDNVITYSSDRISLSCGLVEGRFPNYERALPAEFQRVYELPSEELMAGLRQASLMTTKETNSVSFTFGAGALVLSAHASSVGESRVEFPVEVVEGGDEEFQINFNPGYILDLLKVLEELSLRVCFKDRKTAGLFTTKEKQGSYSHIIMPLVLEKGEATPQ